MIDYHCASLSLPKEYSMGFFPDGLSPSDQPHPTGLNLPWYKLRSLKLTNSMEAADLKMQKLQITFTWSWYIWILCTHRRLEIEARRKQEEEEQRKREEEERKRREKEEADRKLQVSECSS